jgi:glycosyltransferase involved in cell wall biosynthesis
VKFSVIIPAHNEESYIGDCLASIEAAARFLSEEAEIVVALNRCTDGTKSICKNHNALIVEEDSKNLAKIRNTAAHKATGNVIVTIDADSRMTANMFEEIVKNEIYTE